MQFSFFFMFNVVQIELLNYDFLNGKLIGKFTFSFFIFYSSLLPDSGKNI
jgi:hypothetical protein